MPGVLVPEYEEREAARFANEPWSGWYELPREERVNVVAHYRAHRLIELHIGDAQAAETKRRTAQPPKGRPRRR